MLYNVVSFVVHGTPCKA